MYSHVMWFCVTVTICTILLTGIITISACWYMYGWYGQYEDGKDYNEFLKAVVALNCNKTSQYESIVEYCNQTNPDAISGRYYLNQATNSYWGECPTYGPSMRSTAILEAYDIIHFVGNGRSE